MRITPQHTEQLLGDGYTVVPGFVTADELAAARANFLRYYPTSDELAAAPQRYPALLEDPDNQQVEFPFAGDALNHMATHPELIAFVEQLLGSREVSLSQAAIWAKYAGVGSFDQTMHRDFEGNTLVYPRDDGIFRQVNMILYYTDVTEELGPTCVVPGSHATGGSLWPPFRPRRANPGIYRHEKPILASAGSLLVFSMRTLHRASEMTAARGARFTQHLVYRSALCPFNGYHHWARFGESPDLQRFIQQTTPRQREAIGFPPPGHPYWNEETLDGVAARYPKMDMTPYRNVESATRQRL